MTKSIIIIKTENIREIIRLLVNRHIDYEIYQENQEKIDIFSDYGAAIKNQQLEKEKHFLEKADQSDEFSEYDQEDWAR